MTRKAALTLARQLLPLHDGACSVRSGTPFHKAFLEMEKAGLVKLKEDSTGMVEVREVKKGGTDAPTL